MIYDLIENLAQQSGLRTEWTQESQHQATARTATVADRVYFRCRTFSALWQLRWAWSGEWRAGSYDSPAKRKSPAEDLASYRAETARRAMREAVVAYPDHPLCGGTAGPGNMEFAGGNYQQAAVGYERLISGQPCSPILTEAYFNLGIVQLRLDEATAVRNAFYQVVDRGYK